MTQNTSQDQSKISVWPEKIDFTGVQPGQKVDAVLSIQNCSTKPIMFHFNLQDDNYFEFLSNRSLKIPAGITGEIKIRFNCKSEISVKSQLEIIGCIKSLNSKSDETFIKVVPIRTGPPKPKLKLSTYSINVGKRAVSLVIEESFLLENTGKVDSKFNIKTNDNRLKINPSSGIIKAFESLRIHVSFAPLNKGEFVHVINVESEKKQLKPLILTGEAIVHNIQFLDLNDNPCQELNFEHIYFSQKKVVKAKLSNKSTIKCRFTIAAPSYNGSSNNSPFSIFPMSGEVKSGETYEIIATFNPSPPQGIKRAALYSYVSKIVIVETSQTFEFRLSATAIPVMVSLDKEKFNFLPQVVNTESMQTFTIKNESDILPVTFSIDSRSHFRFQPQFGKIGVKGQQKVSVFFTPWNYGSFDFVSKLSICSGLLKKELHLIGESIGKGNDKKFKRDLIFQSPDRMGPFAITKEEYQQKLRANEEGRKLIHDFAEKKRRQDKIIKLTNEIVKESEGKVIERESMMQYVKRTLKERLNKEPENPENGLIPPVPLVPKKAFLEMAEDNKLNLIRSPKRLKKQNLNFSEKFKTKPTTHTESEECSRILTPAQLSLVIPSVKMIDFGELSILSTSKRQLPIQNGMDHHILITFTNITNNDLKIEPESMVIPPGKTGLFDLFLTPSIPDKISCALKYTVNGTKNSIEYKALAIPIDVRLSSSVLRFRFHDEPTTPFIIESVNIMNNSDIKVELKWTLFNSIFRLEHCPAFVESKKTVTAKIRFVPGTESVIEHTVMLHATGCNPISLVLIGETGNGKIVFDKKKIKFGNVPISIEKEVTITLVNKGQDVSVFRLSEPSLNEFQVTPTFGYVNPGRTSLINVKFYSNKIDKFSDSMTLYVCGQSSTKIPITAETLVPLLHIEGNLDFGTIFCGSSATKPLVITNNGGITTLAKIDIKDPAFHIECPFDLVCQPEGSNNNAIFCTEPNKVGVSSTISTLETSVYTVKVQQNSSITVNLVFKPTEPNEYNFVFPITYVGLDHRIQSPVVRAASINSPLSISEKFLDFGVCPVVDKYNPNNRPKCKQIVLSNEFYDTIYYRFNVTDPNIFDIKSGVGEITYSDRAMVFFTFNPKQERPYYAVAELWCKVEGKELLINKVTLTGMGSSRYFRTNVNELVLPVVPLGVRVCRTIDIVNVANIEAKIDIKEAISIKTFPLVITFPKGQELSHSTPSIPLSIEFSSPKPISFSTQIALVDNKGGTYSFTIYASTDNSVFTLYPFLSFSKYKLSSVPGKSIQATLVDDVEPDFLSKFLTTDLLDIKENERNICDDFMCNFMKNYLNSYIMKTPISVFPDDFPKSEGLLLCQIIETLTNDKKLQGFSLILKSFKSKDGNSNQFEKMKSLLSYLKSHGAMFPTVQPEFLLTKESFIFHMRDKITRNIFGLDYYGATNISSIEKEYLDAYISSEAFNTELIARLRIADILFHKVSADAWLQVILQVIKLFHIPTVQRNNLSKLHDAKQPEEEVNETKQANLPTEVTRSPKKSLLSNIYNSRELEILKWISVTCNGDSFGDDLKAFTSFNQLSNLEVIHSLIHSHCPQFDFQVTDMSIHDSSELLGKLDRIQFGMELNHEMLLNGNYVTYTLIAHQLYNWLPSFISVARLEITCQLSRQGKHVFQLTNPSSSKITYDAIMREGVGFTLEKDRFTVDPNKTVDIDIFYFAKKHDTESCYLTLMPVIDNNNKPVRAAPVVVDLVAKVDLSETYSNIEVENEVYSVGMFELNVENPTKNKDIYNIYTRSFVLDNDRDLFAFRIAEFVNSPNVSPAQLEADTPFDHFLVHHQSFVFSKDEVDFRNEQSCSIRFEFIPTSIARYCCLVLFVSAEAEFIYAIYGNSIVPEKYNNVFDVKTENNKEIDLDLHISVVNPSLCNALAYSIVRADYYKTYMSETKFNDTVTFRAGEISHLMRDCHKSTTFSVENSAENYYTIDKKIEMISDFSAVVKFKPQRPGDYPCRLLFHSENDTRLYFIKGIAVAQTKTLTLDIVAEMGKSITQEIPLENPSMSPWTYNISISEENKRFNIPSRVICQPSQTTQVPLTFNSNDIGDYSCKILFHNTSKDVRTYFHVNVKCVEPPSLGTIKIDVKAKEKYSNTIDIESYIPGSVCDVINTVPFLTCPEKVSIVNGKLEQPFIYEVFAPISGITAGQIKIKDPETGLFVWYVVEITVNKPEPEEVLEVSAVTRETAEVSITVSNPTDKNVKFEVELNADDLFGQPSFEIGPKSTYIYNVVFSPLKEGVRQETVTFNSEDAGEFCYLLKLNALPPDVSTLIPLSAAVGETDKTSIYIENPLNKQIICDVTNSLPEQFEIDCGNRITLGPCERKQVNITYKACSIGVKEVTLIKVFSCDLGSLYYRITGIGKPPPPQSPTTVVSRAEVGAPMCVYFSNPFLFTARFVYKLNGDRCFTFFDNRQHFTLPPGHQSQVSFIFTPPEKGRYNAQIVISCVDLNPSPQFIFPIIGSTLDLQDNYYVVKGKANVIFEQNMVFNLYGENDDYSLDKYICEFEFDDEHNFLDKYIDLKLLSINQHIINSIFTFKPYRPIITTAKLTITNEIRQKWEFTLEFEICQADPQEEVIFECKLNSILSKRVSIENPFIESTAFRAYLASGSANEFSVDPSAGYIFVLDGNNQIELPINIIFRPRIYGTILKALLVVDTKERQFLFKLSGKIPEYVPPLIPTSCLIDTSIPSILKKSKKRNYIKDNIESARTPRNRSIISRVSKDKFNKTAPLTSRRT